MKSIMISIKPQWVEKILKGEKTIEIRKTMPKCELPVKVYIYETKSKYKKGFYNNLDHKIHYCEYFGKGKVVAEFTLNKVDRCGEAVYDANRDLWEDWNTLGLNNSCVHPYDLEEYSNGYELYSWHIDNLKIYDRPKELSEFKHWVVDCQGWCSKRDKSVNCYVLEDIKRPPQSWCYCEELEVDNAKN